MKTIDLHNHSTASDGTDSPGALVELAASLGLAAVGITDHDCVSGVAEAVAAGERLGIEVVPGIEVSSDYMYDNVHILGYYIDINTPELRPVLDWVKNEREQRNERIAKMFTVAGFDITMEELRATYPGAVIGRPHMAELLMKKGYTKSIKEGFDRYVGEGRPFYLPKRRISIEQAVDTIRRAGGIPVLAHPLQYHFPEEDVLQMFDDAKSLGIRAVEAYYSEHSPEEQAWVLAQAEKYGFAVTGGSDYHGSRKTHIRMGTGMGSLAVPATVLDELKRIKASMK